MIVVVVDNGKNNACATCLSDFSTSKRRPTLVRHATLCQLFQYDVLFMEFFRYKIVYQLAINNLEVSKLELKFDLIT